MISMRLMTLAALSCTFVHSAFAADEPAPVEKPAEPAIEVPVAVVPDVIPAAGTAGMSIMEEGSYLLGLNVAMQIQQAKGQLGQLDNALILAGIEDVLKGKPYKVDPRARSEAVFGQLQKAMVDSQKGEFAAQVKIGSDFLATLKDKAGVVFTDSGMAYEIIKAAEGKKPMETSQVVAHYHGTHIDGSVFDSSVDRGEPTPFALNRVIKGWTEGLQLMSVGSKYRFYIPQDLAYGERGSPPKIKPGELLIFDVELIEVK